jgi:hypothetical protein
MAQQPIWPGSGSFTMASSSQTEWTTSSSTPWGLYDSEATFASASVNFAHWSAKRLGYPIMAVELQAAQFFACYEEATAEYAAQVNQFNIKDNLLNAQGQPTSSTFTHRNIKPSMGRTIELADQYGTEVGVGGDVQWKKGKITIHSGSQTYDLNALFSEVSESGKGIEVKRIYYEASPAIRRYFDPYATTGYGSINLIEGFGFGSYSPAVSFTLMPIYEDLLRIQAIEFNDSIRKSAYTFEMTNNQLRIFPNPTSTSNLYFDYIVKEDRDDALRRPYGTTSGSGVVSDYSNIPYDDMKYTAINSVGVQWIRKYGLALSKELLGMIRGKYGTIPIPNADTTLDGETLRQEAQTEKEYLISQLREMLELTGRKALMEQERDEAQALQEKLQKIPYPIYIG